jgi:uncharacterized protein YbaP (TraB family)
MRDMLRKPWWHSLLWIVAALASAGAAAETNRQSIWSVKGRSNTIYLLGSVHMLPQDASNLPADALRAYDDAEALVMEVDLGQLPAGGLPASARALTHLPEGLTLPKVLGRRATARLAAHAKRLGVAMQTLAPLQPWFAAVVIEQQELARLGFDHDVGVDIQLARRAQSDHKQIIALETAEQQLRLFAGLSLRQQREYLLYTLEDLDNTAADARELVSAWRSGDTTTLERRLAESASEFPALHRRLTVDRNLRWLPTISRLAGEGRDYLVVVGTLHLVGRDGIVDLLKRAGFEVRQL